MDVRCEKCGTEYELDEARLKPGGVTVKCTSCGHMFKIRKRAPTNVGMPALTAPPPATSERSQRVSTGVPRPQTQTGGSGPNSDRNWIIRLPNGEQRTCKELSTLQQWIVQREIGREAMISRSGKTWKQLGDIPELAQFFGVAEEVRHRRDSGRVTSPQQPVSAVKPALAPASKPAAADKATLLGFPTAAPAPANDATVRAKPPAARATTTGKAPVISPPIPAPPPTPQPGAAAAPRMNPRPRTTPPPAPRPSAPAPQTLTTPLASPESRSTGAWATDAIRQAQPEDGPGDSPFGGRIRVQPGTDEPDFGGQLRSVPTTDVAFGSTIGRLSPPDDADGDRRFEDDMLMPPKTGGLGKWIAIAALLIIAGAAATFYFVVWKPDHANTAAGTGSASASAGSDAAVAVVGTIDAGVKKDVTPPPPADDLAADQALAALRADDPNQLDRASAALSQGDATGLRLALRARISTEIAQDLEDQATVTADTKAAEKLRKDSKQKVADALILAQKALKLAPDEAMAHVAMADVLRLQGKDAKSELARALDIAKSDREALLVQAMADGSKDELSNLDTDPSADLRPRFRLAMLAYKNGDAPAAQQAAEDVIGVNAGHAAAKALLARLAETVATTDPMPPEDHTDHGGSAGTGKGTGTGSATTHTGGGTPEPSGDYDSLLNKGDTLAQNGHCDEAMTYYAKALDLKSNGVAALTGRGYCFIDTKQFSSAFSSFRAALAVSSRYEPALWGMAEAYQQQGLKDKAIEAYMNYLEVYPDSAKAKKQIERLGGSVDGSSGGGGSSDQGSDKASDTTPPPPPPPPSGGSDTGSGSATP